MASIKLLDAKTPLYITAEELMSKPIYYNGKNVAVFGYIIVEYEVLHLKSHKDCAHDAPQLKSAVWLDFSPSKSKDESDRLKQYLNNWKKYVPFNRKCGWVYGVYDKDIEGHFTKYVGGIKDISEMTLTKK